MLKPCPCCGAEASLRRTVQRVAYQRSRGQTTYRLMQDVMNDPTYKHLSAADRSEVLAQVKSYSNYVAKKEFLSTGWCGWATMTRCWLGWKARCRKALDA